LFWVFFKIGSFTFGGGLAMLPLIQKEVVDNRKWVKEEEILDIFAVSQSMPGVIAVNTSIFIGKNTAGLGGAIAAALGVVLPAFFSIIIVLLLLSGLKDNVYVSKVFSGIKAASAALILLAAVKLGKSAIKGKSGYIIAIISFLMIVVFNISAAWAIVFGGVAGYASYFYNRRKK
jgi:chromate transporter